MMIGLFTNVSENCHVSEHCASDMALPGQRDSFLGQSTFIREPGFIEKRLFSLYALFSIKPTFTRNPLFR
jgi:hypothetical protein